MPQTTRQVEGEGGCDRAGREGNATMLTVEEQTHSSRMGKGHDVSDI